MGQDFLGTITGPKKSSLQLILRLIIALMLLLMLMLMLIMMLVLMLIMMLVLMLMLMLMLILILMPGDSLVPPSTKLTLNLCAAALARMRGGRSPGDWPLPYKC